MRLQDPIGKLKAEKLPNCWEAIRRIQATLGVEHREMADWLGFTREEYFRYLSGNQDLPATSMMALSERLGVGFDLIITNSLDYKALAQHHSGNRAHLPEKYQLNALSKRRTVISILDYIEVTHGWEFKQRLFRKFQLNEAMFKNPDAPINVRLSVEIADQFYEKDGPNRPLVKMGKSAVFTHRHSPMGKELARSRTVNEVLEAIFSGLLSRYIEKNFHWKILKLNSHRAVIEGTPSDELRASLPEAYVNNRAVCLFRQGFIASLPMYIDQPLLQVEERSCVAQGDPCCRFELAIPPHTLRPQTKGHDRCDSMIMMAN